MAGYSNYQVQRNKAHKGNDIFKTGRNFNKTGENMGKSERLMEGIGIWWSERPLY